ncbi:amyloid beta A4 precursor protein-binding family B member 1-interacting protein-like [Diretmus argenteus]
MEDIDAIFSDLLGEMNLLTQSLGPDVEALEREPGSQRNNNFSIGFTDQNESLNELEDHDLDALMADLGSKLTTSGERPTSGQGLTANQNAPSTSTQGPASLALPSNDAESSRGLQMTKPQTKADKIRLALVKLKEAQVRKLIVKVLMSDGSSKILMVDERQTVREVLDKLFEKTHCDRSVDWSLCETNPELQTERGFEDHEHLVEPLSAWARKSGNKICFVPRPQKYLLFKDPAVFYMWKKDATFQGVKKEAAKELLFKENFEGSSLIVPDLEGVLYLKEDGKKAWKRRYFLLRASGIYYVPKGKTKSSSDLSCFVHFEKVNIYTTTDYKHKYRAPTDSCFILKHPCIQKESHYIKFLCCDDEHTLSLWVNAIRVAKYGMILYKNYQAAVKRASSLPSTLPLHRPPAWRPSTPSTAHKVSCRGNRGDLRCQTDTQHPVSPVSYSDIPHRI